MQSSRFEDIGSWYSSRIPWSWSFASSMTCDTARSELRHELTSEGAGLWRNSRKKASFSFSAIRLWMASRMKSVERPE